ncbi:MAG: hypothetical protein AB8B53_01470 [Flavobacteriales bacterium]
MKPFPKIGQFKNVLNLDCHEEMQVNREPDSTGLKENDNGRLVDEMSRELGIRKEPFITDGSAKEEWS